MGVDTPTPMCGSAPDPEEHAVTSPCAVLPVSGDWCGAVGSARW